MRKKTLNRVSDNFIKLQKLGQGSFGIVSKVKRLSDDQVYAMKSVRIINVKEKEKKNALKEINILAAIEHPNIINYKQAFFDQQNGTLCTVMELAANGDLAQKIKTKKLSSHRFYQHQIWNIGRDVILGIEALHRNNILHRDIKPANIFFDDQNNAKIGDMNVSTCLKNRLAHTQTGTPYYASPQVWNNESYSYQCDIWSFGCVMYELCCLTQPFKGKDMDAIYQKIRKCKFENIPSHYSQALREVVFGCLSLKNKRLSLVKIKQIFQINAAPKSRKDTKPQQLSCNLNQTILFPQNLQQLSKCLPNPKYIQNESTNEEDQFYSMIERQKPQQQKKSSFLSKNNEHRSNRQPSILDRFLKARQKLIPNVKEQEAKLCKYSCQKTPLGYYNSKNSGSQRCLSKNRINISGYMNPENNRSYITIPKPSFQCAIQNPQSNLDINLRRYDKFALQRLNLRRRKLRIAMKM